MELGLSGKRAIVLAGTKGLGRAAATALAGEGCRVAVCARDGEAADALARELGGFGAACDVADAAALDRFLEASLAALGGVDVLVTNCGGPAAGATDALADDDWQYAFELVFLSAVRACRRLVPIMRDHGWGRVVLVTSGSVREPIPGLALSNAFRPALAGFAKTLALEVASDGVLVHCVMPGAFLTDRGRGLAEDAALQRGVELDQVLAEMRGRVPVGRLGEPEELGRMVAFLASEACSFTTGSVIPVEGGQVRGI